jgi:hypothetical protein
LPLGAWFFIVKKERKITAMDKVKRMIQFKKVILAMVFITISMIYFSNSMISARAVYSFQDQALETKEQTLSNISGSHMVWTESDAAGYLQVVYQNIKTTEKKQITTFASQKHSPRVGESKDGKVYIIWTDDREYVATGKWIMYGYELSSGRDWKLNAHTQYYTRMNMNGSEFVGHDNSTYDIYHYDLITNTETLVGKGCIPVVADGKVLFQHENDGGLSLTNVKTGDTRVVLDLPYHLYVWELAFDGTTALYKHSDLDLKTKYVVLDTSNSVSTPVDLTPATKKPNEYFQMYIGNGQVSWVQDDGGIPVLYGYHLAHKEGFKVTEGDQALRVAGFDKDGLVMKNADGGFFNKAIIRTEVPDYISSGGMAPVMDDSVKKKVNAQGGELSVKDGSVALVIPPGALSQDTDIEIKLNKDVTDSLSITKKGSMREASKAWVVTVGSQLLQKAQLTLTYDNTKWSELQTQKMVIYRWNESANVWVAVSTRLGNGSTGITADMEDSGTYALFVNDVTFDDGKDHWARTSMEILASRDIVDGLSENQFVPEGLLTRAQFTKMLVGALQLKPKAGASSTFTDVSRDHWSYGWVEAAVSAGLVQGDGTSFNPDAELTREQMMIMLVRAMGSEQQAIVLSDKETEQGLAYSDSQEISSWARKYAALSSKSGLIEGDNGAIRPKDSSTRAQAATVVYRLLKKNK